MAGCLPAAVMIMNLMTRNAAKKKDTRKPPVQKDMRRLISARMIIVISNIVGHFVPVITLLASLLIIEWEKPATGNMLPANARPAAQDMIIPPFLRDMFRMVRLA